MRQQGPPQDSATSSPRGRNKAIEVALPLLPDLGLAALLGVFALLLLGLPYRQHLPGLPAYELPAALALGTTIPLALRRLVPELCLAVIAIAYVANLQIQTQQLSAQSLGLWIAIFSVGAYGRSRLRTWLRAVVALTITGYVGLHVLGAAPALGADFPFVFVATVSYNMFLLAASWMMGDWHRQRATYERELDNRARQLERDRIERERRVVRDERVRIARELHDVVAHHVSVMGIQAGAARTVLPESPDRAKEMLAAIETSSRRAVDEMHRLLNALREEDAAPSTEQAPRLRQLDALVDAARATGLKASLEVRGSPPEALPETLDLSTYRIVQEALTNVIKHARARRVDVSIAFTDSTVDVRVKDDGAGSGSVRGPGGRGIVGMRERAALFGGQLEAGPVTGGGFAVDAHLPIPS